MLKKGSQTSLDVALSAAPLKNNKPETKAAVADMVVNNAKCSQQSALLVEKKRLFLSNLQVTSQYIAVSVINHAHVTIGKSMTFKPSKLKGLEGF